MKINVIEKPSVWELDGDSFFCNHIERIVVESEGMTMGFDGPVEHKSHGYECVECGEVLEGSPEEDAYDSDGDYERESE